MKRILTMIVLLIAVATTAFADEIVFIDGLWYFFNSDGTSVSVECQTVEGLPPYSLGRDLTIPPSVTYNGTTYSVTGIRNWAFLYCSIFKATLPTSIKYLGEDIFSETLRDLYVHWDDPITISEDVFEYCYKNTILHVPEGAEKYYRARQGWKNFETIWEDAETDGVTAVHIDQDPDAVVDVRNISGQLIRRGVRFSEALHGLPSGIYIVGDRKVVVP